MLGTHEQLLARAACLEFKKKKKWKITYCHSTLLHIQTLLCSNGRKVTQLKKNFQCNSEKVPGHNTQWRKSRKKDKRKPVRVLIYCTDYVIVRLYVSEFFFENCYKLIRFLLTLCPYLILFTELCVRMLRGNYVLFSYLRRRVVYFFFPRNDELLFGVRLSGLPFFQTSE